MKILSLNCGSSSVKYTLYDWKNNDILARGVVERVTIGSSFCVHEIAGDRKIKIEHDCPDHAVAIKLVLDTLMDPEYGVIRDVSEISGVGHRVVHGGEKFVKSVLIDDHVLRTFKELIGLAPLHNPSNILGIEAARRLVKNAPHVAVIDTAWHQTLLPAQFMYALPFEWYEQHGIRRYGFHGTSLLYVAKRGAALLGREPSICNMISLHIGNGASANAVKNGLSYDTSMGLTPMEGLVMGTRTGDIDPAIVFHMLKKEKYSPSEIETIFNKRSGILGITGKYADRRDVTEAVRIGDTRSELALQIEAYRIRKYIGAYAAALGKIDALIWTGGVGEMSSIIRAKAMDNLDFMGLSYDRRKNEVATSRNAEFDISASSSKIKIFVIPTDEELVMAEDVVAIIEGRYDLHTRFRYSFCDAHYRNKARDIQFAKELKEKPKMAIALAQPFPDILLPEEAKAFASW